MAGRRASLDADQGADCAIEHDARCGAGISQTRIGDLLLLAPAAAKLFSQCMRLDFNGGVLQFNIPHAAAHATPLFAG
jgi:hypothetical protein